MRLGYVVFNEAVWRGVTRSQVLELIKIRASRFNEQIVLVAFLPLLCWFTSRQSIAMLRHDLRASGVKVVLFPIPFLFSRYFLIRWFMIPVLFALAFLPLLRVCRRHKIQVLHGRAYPASLLSLGVSALLGCKLVFDPRSPFPEEHVLAGNWSRTSLTFRIWKYLERVLLARADLVVSIGPSFSRYLRDTYLHAKIAELPLSVDTQLYKRDDTMRTVWRHRLDIEQDEYVFVYCGSIGGWNNPTIYADLMARLLPTTLPIKFVFVVPGNLRTRNRLRRAMESRGVTADQYVVLHVPQHQIRDVLSAADLGMQLLAGYDLTRVGVKFPEYLAMSLPVLANPNAGGAAAYIQRLGCGIVITVNSADLEDKLRSFLESLPWRAAMARSVAEQMFDHQHLASKYVKEVNLLCR